MAKSIEDIFNDDEFGLLDAKIQKSEIKTDEDRLLESFEEINDFFEKNRREPQPTSMSEYALFSRLKEFKANEARKQLLKTFDRHNLLGEIETKIETLDDILNDDDFGLLDSEGDNSIFEFKHTPLNSSRDKAEYIAQRQSMSEKEFARYDLMFKQVHQELKEGKRKFEDFKNAEDNLVEGNFYLVDGLLCYLKVSKAEKVLKENKSGDRMRLEGRTVTIFENATISNMLFRSLGKAIQKNGKLITNPDENIERQLFENAGVVKEEDVESGWIYILKSKSDNKEIQNIQDLYKIGFSKLPVKERVRNAKKEATYLFADVEIIDSFACYNLNIHQFENLIHRFFAEVCLNIDLYDKESNRYIPREWFSVPLEEINTALDLLINGNIIHYKYDVAKKQVVLK
ncbi:MAG: GIY-YIG nuclease family protein, partial [Chryseobacterium sp.]|uniref:GIY-YIG nuclease family protein n=1 Tax=Chryseobacterium lactis TaxID=1241981 RepID=UPI001627A9DB|nr:GIY-YIG nuclease family protein [Chryseobacterium lactis]MDN5478851.1 GIY-YIG nuclease family protein [Chryseobacterium sp.]